MEVSFEKKKSHLHMVISYSLFLPEKHTFVHKEGKTIPHSMFSGRTAGLPDRLVHKCKSGESQPALHCRVFISQSLT